MVFYGCKAATNLGPLMQERYGGVSTNIYMSYGLCGGKYNNSTPTLYYPPFGKSLSDGGFPNVSNSTYYSSVMLNRNGAISAIK